MPLVPPDEEVSTPVEPTPLEKFKKTFDQIIIDSTNTLEKEVFNKLMTIIWSEDLGEPFGMLSPADKISSLGTEAYNVFQLAAGLQQMILTAKPTAKLLQPNYERWKLTFNKDGSVTVEEVAEPDPEGVPE